MQKHLSSSKLLPLEEDGSDDDQLSENIKYLKHDELLENHIQISYQQNRAISSDLNEISQDASEDVQNHIEPVDDSQNLP